MTGVDEAGLGAGGPRGFLAPYADIFAIPRAWRFSVAGIIGRMPMSMYGLGTVLLISAGTGRYGVAGSVSAAGSLGGALCAPQLGRLVDRVGQHRVLVPVCLTFALAVAGLAAAVMLGAPDWTLFLCGIAGGATMPQTGPMARARWSVLLAGSPRLHTAFSLESVADELCFVIGPAAVTMLATQVHPAAGITCAALCAVGGSLWFAAQRSTEPPAAPVQRSAKPPKAGRPGAGRLNTGLPHTGLSHTGLLGRGLLNRGLVNRGTASTGPPRARRLLRLAAPSLLVLAPAFLFIGAMFVTIDLSTVAFAARFGHKDLSGLLLACYAAGSGTGGLWYGTRTWHAPAWRRLAVTLPLTAGGVCTFWAMPNLLVLAPVIYCCGLTIAPTLIAGYSLLEATALPGPRYRGDVLAVHRDFRRRGVRRDRGGIHPGRVRAALGIRVRGGVRRDRRADLPHGPAPRRRRPGRRPRPGAPSGPSGPGGPEGPASPGGPGGPGGPASPASHGAPALTARVPAGALRASCCYLAS